MVNTDRGGVLINKDDEAPECGKWTMFYDNTFRQGRVQTAREAPSDTEGPRSSKQVTSAIGQQVSGGITHQWLDVTARVGRSLLVKG